MKDLMKYFDECKKELDSIGIKYGNISKVDINYRWKNKWGICHRNSIDDFEITISHLLLDDNSSTEGLKNVIIHELLHSIKGGMTHKGAWKQAAQKVKRLLGYDITRCKSFDNVGINQDLKPVFNYIVRCEKCAKEYHYYRKSKVVQHPELYRCGKCEGKLFFVENN